MNNIATKRATKQKHVFRYIHTHLKRIHLFLNHIANANQTYYNYISFLLISFTC